MQATVHAFDPDQPGGSVVTDEGVLLPFDAGALAGSGLRHVRPGQRLTVTVEGSGAGRRVVAFRLGRVGVVPDAAAEA